ncbi:vacuolar protein sorting-associated protein 54-like [Anneissia japonica]|uniref:vacuolar protein sorting-associated protein 54-like n=1 Tax=Anneissia japonica TaxID=1529436 RepID=UPI00142561FA|nr:vacuolar protein sorting-associated protein 54-like [Anneissia japonica]
MQRRSPEHSSGVVPAGSGRRSGNRPDVRPSIAHEPSNNSNRWKVCDICSIQWKSPSEFALHLREKHCTKEGGSFVCRYGTHGICPSLPLEGVSDKDYEFHVARDHIADYDYTSKLNPELAQQSRMTNQTPSIVSDQLKWTFHSSSVNLPAVLNDPRKSRREHDFFTKTWGEGFVEKTVIAPSPYLPVITKAHFEKYLNRTANKLKSHKVQSSLQQSVPRIPVATDKSRLELEQIPKMFFRGDFALENPETFQAVLPWSQFKNRGAGQSSKLLQEKLSHYLDLVEVELARQISQRSTAFFTAMASHDQLQDRLISTCTAIKGLRERIMEVDDVLAKRSLETLSYKVSRVNHVKVFNKLKLMATVHQTQPTIQLLLSTSEFVGALDLISTTQEVLTQELSGIQSFRHLGSQLIELEKLIDKMMHEEFVRFATADLTRPLDEEAGPDEEKLSSIILGLLRQHKFSFLDDYKDECTTAIKAIVKQTVVDAVSEADSIDVEGNLGSLADQMRLLNFTEWLQMFQNVFTNLAKFLSRVKMTWDVMNKLIDFAAGHNAHAGNETADNTEPGEPQLNSTNVNGSKDDKCPQARVPSPLTFLKVSDVDILIAPVEHQRLNTVLKEVLVMLCDYAHDRSLKLLIARGKDGFLEKLSSSEFVSLSRSVETFVSQCEAVSGRRSNSLRGGLQNQANKFVNRFHEERKTKMSLLLDNERWKQAEVPANFQDLLSAMAKGEISLDLLARMDQGNEERKSAEYVEINGGKYAVIGTVLMLLKMVAEYCQCVEDIPSVTIDILTRLIEIFQNFNSRSCQLVLGAGALQLVGLKTITTKNLGLASRCLQLIGLYIPIVKEFFAARLLPRQMMVLRSFDKILKDYNDHVQEISNKLIAIMDDTFMHCLSKWEVKAPVPSLTFREICKRIRKIHEAIVDILPPEQIKDLFVQMNTSFKTHLKKQLITLNVTNDGGPQHGLVTSELVFYTECVQLTSGLDKLDNMNDIWVRR